MSFLENPYNRLPNDNGEVSFDESLSYLRRIELSQMKVLLAVAEMQMVSLPSYMTVAIDYQTVAHDIAELKHLIEEYEETFPHQSLNQLQMEAVKKYGGYGFLIEELRDSANGKLPECFTEMGNLLARYVERDIKDKNELVWCLESMKNAIQKQINEFDKMD